MLGWIYLAAVEGVNFMNNFDKLMIKKNLKDFFSKLAFSYILSDYSQSNFSTRSAM